MTTKKNRNKIHASSEKLTTTKKSNIMKGGTPQDYYEATNIELLHYINENNLEIKLVDVNGNESGADFFDYGEIANPDDKGFIGKANLKNGDIILSYETINIDGNESKKYAFISKKDFTENINKERSISKISYITRKSIETDLDTKKPRNYENLKSELVKKIKERIAVSGKSKKELEQHLKSNMITEETEPDLTPEAGPGVQTTGVQAKVAPLSAVRAELQKVYDEKHTALTEYFNQKRLDMSTSPAVQINKDNPNTSLGVAVNPESGIIAGLQPTINGITQSQVKVAGLDIGDLILDYMINDINDINVTPRKVYTFINETDMEKKTDGKNITIYYVKGIKTDDVKESKVLNKLIKDRRTASIALDELITLESNDATTEEELQSYITSNRLQTHYLDTDNNNNGLATLKSGNGTIINLGEDGSLYTATLRTGDIILTYNVSNNTYIYIGLTDFSNKTKDATSIGITYIKHKELGNKKDELIRLIDARIKAKIELDDYLAKLKKSPSANTPDNTGNKNTSVENSAIENAIGAIILALALTISDSNPNTKKRVGANSPETEAEYEELTNKIATITKERVAIEKKFNEIKTESNKKKKKEGLIKILNELLINKQDFAAIKHPKYGEPSGIRPVKIGGFTGGQGCAYDDPNPEPLCELAVKFYNSRNRESQEYRRTINEIMSYLIEQKINIRYQWVKITETRSISSDYTAPDIYRTSRRVGIISKLNYDNTREGTAIGPWGFEVWIPDRRGFEILVRPDANGLKKKLKVINDKEEIIDKFKTENISLSYIEFLTDKQYDPTNDVNYKPVIIGEDPEATGSIGRIKGMRQGLNKGLNAVTSISPVTGTYTNVESIAKSASARGLREDLKGLIKDVIENKFKETKKDVDLLNTIINFYNKKRSIKDILISKISYIFASGETRLNLFNRKNLAKNFKPDEEEGENKENEEDNEKGKIGGANEEADDLEGGGGYGFRNFDKKDAENIIRLILDNLTELEKASDDTKLLLFSTYLKKFLKITPSELNKILQDITRVKKLSEYVITHYINRLNGNQDTKEEKEEKDNSPAAKISKLNFALKNNVQSFIGSIVYITLHTEQMVGSEAKIQYYLDNEYNKAMKLPTGEEQTRIDNFHLKKSLDDIFGENNSIKDYRNKLKTIDSYIDSMNEKNIENVLQEFPNVFKLATLEGEKIIYKIPGNIKAIIKEKAEDKKEATAIEESSKIKLAQAEKLVKELLDKYPESVAAARPIEAEGAEGAEGTGKTVTTVTTGTGITAETAKHAELRTNLQRLLETLGTPPSSSSS
jgi:hypothetical protein